MMKNHAKCSTECQGRWIEYVMHSYKTKSCRHAKCKKNQIKRSSHARNNDNDNDRQ